MSSDPKGWRSRKQDVEPASRLRLREEELDFGRVEFESLTLQGGSPRGRLTSSWHFIVPTRILELLLPAPPHLLLPLRLPSQKVATLFYPESPVQTRIIRTVIPRLLRDIYSVRSLSSLPAESSPKAALPPSSWSSCHRGSPGHGHSAEVTGFHPNLLQSSLHTASGTVSSQHSHGTVQNLSLASCVSPPNMLKP